MMDLDLLWEHASRGQIWEPETLFTESLSVASIYKAHHPSSQEDPGGKNKIIPSFLQLKEKE